VRAPTGWLLCSSALVGLLPTSCLDTGLRALGRHMYNTRVSGNVSGWKAMTQARFMCVHQRRHGVFTAGVCMLGGGSALTWGRAVRRYLRHTQVSGDVSSWKAMTKAGKMCVQHRRHGACVSALCLLAGGSALTLVRGAAQTPGEYPGDRRR
jgi:hypothetical protein